MSDYALGKKAIAVCDRCGFQYKLHQLKPQYTDLKDTGLLVCLSCMDEENPQLQLGRWPVDDPQAVKDPRPDTGLEEERLITGLGLRWDFVKGLPGVFSPQGNSTGYNGWGQQKGMADGAIVAWTPSNTILVAAPEDGKKNVIIDRYGSWSKVHDDSDKGILFLDLNTMETTYWGGSDYGGSYFPGADWPYLRMRIKRNAEFTNNGVGEPTMEWTGQLQCQFFSTGSESGYTRPISSASLSVPEPDWSSGEYQVVTWDMSNPNGVDDFASVWAGIAPDGGGEDDESTGNLVGLRISLMKLQGSGAEWTGGEFEIDYIRVEKE